MMGQDRYIVVTQPGYYGARYVAQDTATGRLEHAPDYRYDVAQKVADTLNEQELVREERRRPVDKPWLPVVDKARGGVVVPLRTVDTAVSA